MTDNVKRLKPRLRIASPRPYKVESGPTVFFDVDDTLVAWNIPSDAQEKDLIEISCRDKKDKLYPNKHNISLLIKLSNRGHSIVVWSGGGSDWAEAVIYSLGLESYVSVITSKPQYYIDDIPNPKEWMGKHGYFTLDGKKIHGDNLLDSQER